MIRRRLSAEQFCDAFSQAIGGLYPDSLVMKKLLPAEAYQDAPFSRAALVANDPFQKALGRPTRETVTTSRQTASTLLQALELTNGSLLQQAIETSARAWEKRYHDPTLRVRQLFRSAIGRVPTSAETELALKAMKGVGGTADLIWAVALHPEFQLIH